MNNTLLLFDCSTAVKSSLVDYGIVICNRWRLNVVDTPSVVVIGASSFFKPSILLCVVSVQNLF